MLDRYWQLAGYNNYYPLIWSGLTTLWS